MLSLEEIDVSGCLTRVRVCICTTVCSNRRPYGDEPEFFVQLFVEYNESMKLPTIGLLLHTMFTEQKLSFLQVQTTNVLYLLYNHDHCHISDAIKVADPSATIWKAVQDLREDHP